jgi:hypothetical protein
LTSGAVITFESDSIKELSRDSLRAEFGQDAPIELREVASQAAFDVRFPSDYGIARKVFIRQSGGILEATLNIGHFSTATNAKSYQSHFGSILHTLRLEVQ